MRTETSGGAVGRVNTRRTVPDSDPVDDLRSALGWASSPGETDKPIFVRTSALPSDTLPSSSPQAVADASFLSDEHAYVTVRDTPLGRYTEAIYEIVQAAWTSMDLPEEEKALGTHGRVTVRFRVHSSGKVRDTSILKDSGYVSLDRMAYDAIPERLPRFPKEIGSGTLVQTITFHYNNPRINRQWNQ
jgi:TonB family protein